MKKYLVEFIGTFFLTFSICISVIGGSGELAPIVFGTVLIGMIYAGGHISGAHYNPAVTVSFHLRGRLPAKEVLPYLIAEFLGGIAAALIACFLLRSTGHVIPEPPQFHILPALISEVIGTFALCLVILNVATANATANNSYYGVAIGCTVIGLAYIFGDFSGAAFNLAVALGGAFLHLFNLSELWIYLVANIVGAVLATQFFLYTSSEDRNS